MGTESVDCEFGVVQVTIRRRQTEDPGEFTSDFSKVTPTCVGGGATGDAASKARPSSQSWRANGTGPGDCIIPPTPQRRRAGGFAKLLELTPLWQQALQYRRLPSGLDRERLFAELTCRLRDPEWEVRQHALRVLVDLAPVLDTSDATRLASAGVIADIADNLGHSAPGVRGGATEALLALATVPGADVAVVLALGKRLVQVTLQESSVRTLASIRERIGNDRFDHLLGELTPQQRRDFESLSHVYGVESPTDNGPPERSAGDSGIDLRMPDSEDTSDTDRVVMKTEIKFDEHTAITMTVLEQDSDAEGSPDDAEHQDEQDDNHDGGDDDDGDGDLSTRSRRRVRFGGEIVKMRTPDSDAAHESTSRDRSSSSSGEESVQQESPPRSPSPSPTPSLSPSLSPNPTPSPSRSPTPSPTPESPPVQSPCPAPSDEESPPVPSPPPVEPPKVESPPPPMPPAAHTALPKSHIPVPITPARRLSQTKLRPGSPTEKRRSENGLDMDAESAGIPNMDGGESLTCSSSEGEATVPALDHYNPAFVEDLYGSDARTAELALQQIQESIFRDDFGDPEECVRLLSGLLVERRPPLFVQTTLACLRRLFEVLPLGQVLSSLNIVVPALCRHIGGGSGNGDGALSVRLEAAAATRALMVAVGPGPVVQVALSPLCLGANSSKIRESALLLLLHATMAFPSRSVDAQRAAKLAAMALADARRRVRQAALDSLATLAQFLAPAALGAVLRDAANAATLRKGDQSAGTGLMAAAHARLARRQLPILGRNGLILYALELQPLCASPSHRPKGADVDWIMAGTGSLSSGSARSRHQLMTSPPAHSFYQGPIGSAQSVPSLRSSSTSGRLSLRPGNPWTERRPVAPIIGTSVRNSVSLNSQSHPRSNQNFNKRSDSFLKDDRRAGSKAAPNNHWIPGAPYEVDPYLYSAYGRQPVLLRSPQDANYPAPQHHQYAPGFSLLPNRLNQTWPPPSITTLASSTTSTSTTTSPANNSQPSANFHSPDSAANWKGRILEPLPTDGRNGVTTRKRSSAGSEGRYEMPPLPLTHPAARPPFNGSPERVSSSDVSGRPARGSATAVPVNGRQPQRQPVALVPTSLHREREANAQGILPGIAPADAHVTDIPAIAPPTPVRRQPVQDSPSNYSLHPPTPPRRSPSPVENHTPSPSSPCNPKSALPTPESPPSPAPKSPTPPPPPASPPSTTPESSSPQRAPLSLVASSEPELNKNPISELSNGYAPDDHDASIEETAALQHRIQQRRRRRTEPSSAAVAANGGLPTRSSSGPRRPTRAANSVRSSLARNRQSEGDWSTPDSLNRSLQQLDGTDWEAAAAALRSLARQLINSTGNNGVHFGAAAQVQARLHVVCEALARQVRNLRSQVARAACDAAKSLFLTFRRAADTETEDLVAALFHRTADTNKFLRADSNAALDAMADSLSPGRAISMIVYKGCRHQNAIVRAEGARLLLRMVDNLGVERIMSQPRETRDLLLVTATRLLTEGSLEARSYAKSLLRTLSRDPHLLAILIEIVPTNVMRNIDKTLKSLMRK